MNKLEKSEAFIHLIGIKCTQSVNESHLFGFAAIIVTTNKRIKQMNSTIPNIGIFNAHFYNTI